MIQPSDQNPNKNIYGFISHQKVESRWDQVAEFPIIGSISSVFRIAANALELAYCKINKDHSSKHYKATVEGLSKGVKEIIPFVAILINNKNNNKLAEKLTNEQLEKELQIEQYTPNGQKWLSALIKEDGDRKSVKNKLTMEIVSCKGLLKNIKVSNPNIYSAFSDFIMTLEVYLDSNNLSEKIEGGVRNLTIRDVFKLFIDEKGQHKKELANLKEINPNSELALIGDSFTNFFEKALNKTER